MMRLTWLLATCLGLIVLQKEGAVESFSSTVPSFTRHNRPTFIPSVEDATPTGLTTPRSQSTAKPSWSLHATPNKGELALQKQETITSFATYNDGTWECRSSLSFSLSSDAAAGVIRRKDVDSVTGKSLTGKGGKANPIYTSVIKTKDVEGVLTMTETFSWETPTDDVTAGNGSSTPITDLDGLGSDVTDATLVNMSTRTIPLDGSTDVDSVDGSYTLDQSLSLELPPHISGMPGNILQLGIEHSLAISDTERVRCFVLYDMQDLCSRVVLLEETKVLNYNGDIPGQETSKNMGDNIPQLMDDASTSQKMELLARAMTKKDANDGSQKRVDIRRYPMELFALVSGVWLGDAVVRSHTPASSSSKSKGVYEDEPESQFANWSNGVQKVAQQLTWDYETKLQCKTDSGRSMGDMVHPQLKALAMGELVQNEMGGAARRRRLLREAKRGGSSVPSTGLICIDYDMGASVGVYIGSLHIRIPRFLPNFSSEDSNQSNNQAFYTEFGVFQSRRVIPEGASMFDDDAELPEVFYSKLSRLYNGDGSLKQGVSTFYSLKRMVPEEGTPRLAKGTFE